MPTVKKLFLGAAEVLGRSFARIGNSYECYCCHRRVGRFLPYRGGMRRIPQAIAALDIIGSDVEHFSCPHCRSHDRERHLFMYFDKTFLWEKFSSSATLHFAPERKLAERIKKLNPKIYIKADLFPASQDILREDITNLSFLDETFDILIANHILEHVPDDAAAMREIFRVLRPGGIAILQTPFSNELETTYEDGKISSDADRFEAYGQEDHVRLYGRDLFRKIESTGFKSLVKTHEQLLSGIDSSLFGVNHREPFFCFQRPISTY